MRFEIDGFLMDFLVMLSLLVAFTMPSDARPIEL